MAQQAPGNAVCPDCGSKMVRIVYGYPGPGLIERSMRGEVALGGCCVTGFDPTHQCGQGHKWRWTGRWTAEGDIWNEMITEFQESELASSSADGEPSDPADN